MINRLNRYQTFVLFWGQLLRLASDFAYLWGFLVDKPFEYVLLFREFCHFMSSLSYFRSTHYLSQTRIQSVLYMMIRRLMLLVIALFDNRNRLFRYTLPQILR